MERSYDGEAEPTLNHESRRGLIPIPFRGNLSHNNNVQIMDPDKKNAMKSRAELLAEIEEKRLENNKLKKEAPAESELMIDALMGYDPYNNTGRAAPRARRS